MIRRDLTGETFNRLTVLRISHFKGEGKRRAVYWLCRCVCGKEVSVRMNGLTSGHAKSCGCLMLEKAALQGKASRTHGKSRTVEHSAYLHARQRCSNPNVRGFENWGGRGIKFLFKSFEEFFEELGPKPSPKHSVDRFPNNDGNYEPGNVRWATREQQNNNRRNHARLL